jgi:3',5'-cyclic AMP phosphodiesterase CpdA
MATIRPFAVLGLLLGLLSAVRAAMVQGTVFDDRNANGVRDAGEPAIAQVPVSNGTEVVLTDAGGHYELPADGDATIFVVKPRGWRPPANARNLPQFYRRLAAGASPPAAVDFPLMRSDEPDEFRALVFTDPQPASSQDVGYLDKSTVTGLAGSQGIAFGVTLGDVVSDRFDLYDPVNASMARIGIPWYNLSGNHDLNLDAADDRHEFARFEAVYGPSTYAFHYGRALFVALNDVRYLGGLRYIGGLREDQFTFLENLLRVTPTDELVVLMMHIPWFYPNPSNIETFRMADRARLFALLKNRPNNLWLSGHTHYQRHVFYGPGDGWQGAQPLHEYNVAAACGSFWGGPPDEQGVPISTMWDGTPRGYAILAVRGTDAEVDYRPAGLPADHQIGLHAPVAVAPHRGYVSFYANVFNGHDGWTVEARLDDRGWMPIRRVLEWDPAYAELYLEQDIATKPLATPRLPDPTVCYHLWRGYLPADLAPGAHSLQVRATDPRGRMFTAQREVHIVDP